MSGYVTHELCEAIDEVAILYAERQFNLAFDGIQDTSVHYRDAAMILAFLYDEPADEIYSSIGELIRLKYSELVHENLPKKTEIL